MADEDEEISYEMLQELVRAERRSNKLMPVPSRFWPKVREFLAAVTTEFRNAQQKDPWSRKAMLLSDEVKNAKHAAENLWALRERKLAMLALARERDRTKPDGITADEGHLYTAILATLDDHRKRVFEGTVSAPPPQVKAGQGQASTSQPAAQPATQPGAPAPAAPGAPAAPATPPATPPAAAPAAPASSGTSVPSSPSVQPGQSAPPAPAPAEGVPPRTPSGGEPIPPDLDQPEPQEADPEHDPEALATSAASASPAAPAAPGATPQPVASGAPEVSPDSASTPSAPASEPLPPDLEAPQRIVVPADSPDEAMLTIRALSDIPQFVGPDMQTYLLQEGDLATLPEGIAKLLVRRKKASLIEDF